MKLDIVVDKLNTHTIPRCVVGIDLRSGSFSYSRYAHIQCYHTFDIHSTLVEACMFISVEERECCPHGDDKEGQKVCITTCPSCCVVVCLRGSHWQQLSR